MRSKLIVFFLLLLCITRGNTQSPDECKYLAALTYLRTNVQINEKIKSVFPKLVNKRDKYVEFNLSSRIDFLGIDYFKGKLSADKHEIPVELINNASLYREKYFFESVESDFLTQINMQSDAKLYLTFSKPVGNYLVAEIGNFDPFINRKVKFGLGTQIFFKFKPNGLVEEVLYGVSAYN